MLTHPAAKYALALLCGYEALAVCGAPWPTLTKLTYTYRDRSRLCRIVVWGALGVLAHHLLVEQPQEQGCR